MNNNEILKALATELFSQTSTVEFLNQPNAGFSKEYVEKRTIELNLEISETLSKLSIFK